MPYRFVATLCPTLSVLALLAAIGLSALAQYRFDHWTTEHGLPQNSVNAVLQTNDGYLWLATNDGLARYDGMRFTVFDRGNISGIGSNRMLSLHKDRRGTLWIGTYEGLLVCYRDGKFSTFTAQQGLPYDPINWIEEDAQGYLWLTGDQGVTRWWNKQGLTYDLLDCLPGLKRGRDTQRRVWWSTNDSGLHIFSGGRIHHYTQQDGLPSLNITTIQPDRRGNLWVSTSDAGTVKLKDGKLSAYPSSKEWWPSGRPSGVTYEDRHRDLWLFDLTDHVLMQVKGGKLTRYASVISFNSTFYEDREGTLWLGSHDGLFRARPTVIHPLTDETLRRALPALNEWVYCILEDRAGTVWLGKWGGGLVRYRNGQFTHHVGGKERKATLSALKRPPNLSVFFEEGLFNARVTSLYEDRAGVIWIGTDEGVSRFKDGMFTRFSDQYGLANVWAIHEDRAGNFWFGTTTGLTRLRDGDFTVYTTRDGLAHNDVKAIYEDRHGTLWLGTHGGLTRYAEGHFTTFTGFGEHQVRTLYEDSDGVLWIGTYGSGLFRFKDGKFTRYTMDDGLFNNGVFQILEDERGNFWLSCNKGIYRVRRQELNEVAAGILKTITAIPYGKEDGMLDVECNGGRQPAGQKVRNGQLWFPTQQGVAIIDPATVKLNTLPPPVVIEECRLAQKEVPFRDGIYVLPGKGQLEIRYTGLSFIKAEHLRFRYKLEGQDNDWIEAGNRRVAYYNQLPLKPYTATYTFIVQAANSDGVWNTEGKSLKIVVAPPWWRTWWFLGLMLLAVSAAIWRGYGQHIARLKRERSMKEAFSRELLASRENERARIARELHDGLKPDLLSIKNQAAELRQDPLTQEQMGEQLDEIAARTDHAIENIAEIVHGLRPPIMEAGLTEALKAIVRRAARASRTRFIDEVGQLDKVLPEHLEIHLYYLVQEAVTNIHRHAQASEAKVSANRKADGLLVTIWDNGRGFDTERVADRRAQGGSFGLTNIADRAAILGSTLMIVTAPGQGTTLTLKLKLSEGHDDRRD